MIDPKTPSVPPSEGDVRAEADGRLPYERPRVVRKKAVTRATLFSGGGGPSSAPPPLVSNG